VIQLALSIVGPYMAVGSLPPLRTWRIGTGRGRSNSRPFCAHSGVEPPAQKSKAAESR
jgi:hypothetical protein